MIKYILIFFGTVSLFLGIAGVFIPGLPTTPFILLTAGLYIKSSPVLYQKISSHRFTAPYINRLSGDISLRTRIISIIVMWVMILLTSFLVISDWRIRILLISLGIAGTIFKLKYLLPSKKTDTNKFGNYNKKKS